MQAGGGGGQRLDQVGGLLGGDLGWEVLVDDPEGRRRLGRPGLRPRSPPRAVGPCLQKPASPRAP
jgi:hypothetical protein